MVKATSAHDRSVDSGVRLTGQGYVPVGTVTTGTV